jgi:hypothetical protein
MHFPFITFFAGLGWERRSEHHRETRAARWARLEQHHQLQRETYRELQDALSDFWKASSEMARAKLVGRTLRTMTRAIIARGASEQLLHGEPHPGNVLRTRSGLLFVDVETSCRGPIEFDIAHATFNASGPPIEAAALSAGADQSLVRECWILMLAMAIAWRCEPGDDLPNGRAMARDWISQLHAALGS